jgi:GTP cyclohydrolase I
MTSEEQNAVKLLLTNLGENTNRKELLETPTRFVNGYKNILSGYNVDASKIISSKLPKAQNNSLIAFEDIEFFSMCEHHFLPFFGTIKITFEPNEYGIGFNTISNLVQAVTRKLQLQERIAKEIGDILISSPLNPKTVLVEIDGQHFCVLSKMPSSSRPIKMKNIYKAGQ